jgi:hypothetical protein
VGPTRRPALVTGRLTSAGRFLTMTGQSCEFVRPNRRKT